MTKNDVTVKMVYELIDKKVGEVNSSVLRLEGKFDTLEQGRVSHLETTVAELQGKLIATTAIISALISIALGVISFFIKK
jgi:hypothetical protein